MLASAIEVSPRGQPNSSRATDRQDMQEEAVGKTGVITSLIGGWLSAGRQPERTTRDGMQVDTTGLTISLIRGRARTQRNRRHSATKEMACGCVGQGCIILFDRGFARGQVRENELLIKEMTEPKRWPAGR